MHEPLPIEHRAGARPAGEPRAWARGLTIATALVAVAGVALRLAAARGDLWLDELWSIRLGVLDAGSLSAVFTRLHHDNNHHLNTLWLMLVGRDASPLACRALAVASSAGLLVLVALRTGLRGGRAEALATTTLVSGSYLLVHYGSEARGYAPAMFFAIAAFCALERHLETGELRWGAAFATASVLGILSHLTFVFVLAGATAWAAAELLRRRGGPARALTLASVLAVPLVATVGLWLVDLRHLVIGRGPPYDLVEVLRELSRTSLGLPTGPLELIALPVLAAAVYELVALTRARDSRAVFFAVAIGLAPAALLLGHRPEFVAPRYFVVAVPFVFMLLGSSLARLADRGPRDRAGLVALLVLFAVGNSAGVVRLLRDGRGRYGEAVTNMLESTTGTVTVGSDHDWRNAVVLDDQARRLGAESRVVYLGKAEWTKDAPEWFLRHDFAERPEPEPLLEAYNGRTYALVAVFPYGGLSGWSWSLYRMVSAPGP